jgi:hypothetical protein
MAHKRVTATHDVIKTPVVLLVSGAQRGTGKFNFFASIIKLQPT